MAQQRQAEQTSAVLASLSHDLKTPLTAILFAIENLRANLPSAERRAQADAALAELIGLMRLFECPQQRRPD
jgi:K+-sensing histidine kinase KdpD